ncbi:MAG: hypothetical protein DRI54_09230 [Bacteroidetes bacterium]|nr:MAG: hypothetical protein DRI54_09230 [Bacteroidota bacterium]
MKTIIALLILVFLFPNFVNAQNDPPVAVNDTVWALYNIKKKIEVRNNDVDPEGWNLEIDTVFYTGEAVVTFSHSSNPNGVIYYTGAIGFIGKDSLQYVIRDLGEPTMYDTAWVFINVKQKHIDFLDINNIKAGLGKDGNIFRDKLNSNPSFEAPKGSGNHSIFAISPWLFGNVGGTIKYSNFTFNESEVPYAGPLMDYQYYSEYDEKWDRVWKLKRWDIIYHTDHWADENYVPIEVITNWPAHGDTTKGQAFYQAPFFDNNEDGIYNPLDGDFPEIRGDQAIFLIYNISRPNIIAEQLGIYLDMNSYIPVNNRSKTEVHALFYAFNCEIDSALDHTVFANIKFINRSDDLYEDAYFGIWADIDIGNPYDDYFECDVDRSSIFGFNGDNEDIASQTGPGYGTNLVAQSVTFLKGVKMDNDGVDNEFGVGENQSVNGLNFGDGVADNEFWGMKLFARGYSFIDPEFPDPWNQQFIYFDYFMNFEWSDGTPLTYGGFGYDPDNPNAINARYMYPGNSDSYFYGTGGIEVPDWSESTENNMPIDQRGFTSTGPFTLLPYDTAEVDLAFVFARDYTGSGNLAPIPIMKERIDSIRAYYLAGQTPCNDFVISVEEFEKEELKSFFSVYPNPFSDFITLDNQSNESMEIVIYNLLGKELMRKNIPAGKTRIDLSLIRDNALIIKAISGDRMEAKKLIRVR